MMSDRADYEKAISDIVEHLGDTTSYVAEAMYVGDHERVLNNVDYAITELSAANKLLKAWRDELEDE